MVPLMYLDRCSGVSIDFNGVANLNSKEQKNLLSDIYALNCTYVLILLFRNRRRTFLVSECINALCILLQKKFYKKGGKKLAEHSLKKRRRNTKICQVF